MQSQDKHDGIASVWQDKQRNYKIDYIKGILITLVVFGHSIQYGSGLTFFSEECYFAEEMEAVILPLKRETLVFTIAKHNIGNNSFPTLCIFSPKVLTLTWL